MWVARRYHSARSGRESPRRESHVFERVNSSIGLGEAIDPTDCLTGAGCAQPSSPGRLTHQNRAYAIGSVRDRPGPQCRIANWGASVRRDERHSRLVARQSDLRIGSKTVVRASPADCPVCSIADILPRCGEPPLRASNGLSRCENRSHRTRSRAWRSSRDFAVLSCTPETLYVIAWSSRLP
jgi:hypothetical protein